MRAPVHPQATERVAILRASGLLEGPADPAFDELASLAGVICAAPVSLVTLLDADRQIFKAARGVEIAETPLELSICAHSLHEHEFLEIPDTSADTRTASNPFCRGAEGYRFYAGAVVRSPGGVPLGTLCVLDVEPRRLEAPQREALMTLSRQVGRLIELQRALDAERTLAREVDHRTKNSLQLVASFLRLQRRRARGDDAVEPALAAAERRVAAIATLHEELYQSGSGHEVDLALLLGRVVRALKANAPAGIELALAVDPLLLPSHKAAAAGLIASEFVTNSIKHAFPNGRGQIMVEGQRVGPDYHLVLADDGIGMSVDSPAGDGLGLDIIEAATHQLAAEPLTETGDEPTRRGTRLALRLPLQQDASEAIAAQ